MAIEAARQYLPLDILTMFCEDTTITATGYVQEDAADKVITLGAGRVDCSWVVDISAIESGSGDENYTFRLLGSNAEDFSGGANQILATMEIGANLALSAIDSVVAREWIGVSNGRGGLEYKYVKLHVTVAGAITTGITFTSWLTRPE